MSDNKKPVEERWHPPQDDESIWIPIRPKNPEFNPKPNTTPKVKPVLSQELVYTGPGTSIYVERGGEYPDWEFPVVVPNVIQNKRYTAEQIKEIAFIHRTHCLSKPSIGHPEFESSDPNYTREKIKEWLDMTENLFLETDQEWFDHILSGLKRRLPNLDLTWKRGVLWINGAKTRIKCKNIDNAWKTFKTIGSVPDIEEFLIELIGKQLSEIFAA